MSANAFVPDTAAITKSIVNTKSQQAEKTPEGLLLLSTTFQTILRDHPTGDPTIVKSPTCDCHRFDEKDVLVSWSWSHPDASAVTLKQLRQDLDEYQILLNKPLAIPRYLVFMTAKMTDLDVQNGKLVGSMYYGLSISVVLKK